MLPEQFKGEAYENIEIFLKVITWPILADGADEMRWTS